MKKISIITPTYNRSYILENLYLSLINQTNQRYEWIIIDDGSVDDTEKKVKKWKDEGKLDLKYFYKENGGKHKALNFGIPRSSYDYIFIVDSDDELSNNAIEKIYNWIPTIEDASDFAGVSGLKGDKNNRKRIGDYPANHNFIDATNLERRKKKLTGDKAEVYKRELLLKNPFPEYENENFLAENSVWDKLAFEGYKIRWFNDIIYYCEYLEDGLTKNDDNTNKLSNFKGYTFIEKMNYNYQRYPYNYLAIARYIEIAKIKKKSKEQIMSIMEISSFQYFQGTFFLWVRKIKNKL